MGTPPNDPLSFEKARYNGVVMVIADQIKQISNLEKKYKLLQSEHNALKRTYLNLLDGHVDIINGKNKTIKQLRLKVKEQKKEFVNDLKKDDIFENLFDYRLYIDKVIEKWEK